MSLVHSSPFDDVSDVLKVAKIFQDIACDDDDIGELPSFDGSQMCSLSHYYGGPFGRCADHLQWCHAMLRHQLHFSPG